jgi:uncharacterized protein YrrD
VYAVQKYFDRFGFQSVSFYHGIYISQGLIGGIAKQKDVRIANWQVAYRKQSFIFSENRSTSKPSRA